MYTKNTGNKLNIGQKVTIKLRPFEWYVKHINEMYLVSSQTELQEKEYEEVASLYDIYLSKKTPIGKVVGYGANDDTGKNRNNVKVRFKTKYTTLEKYFNEDDVKRVK